VLPPLTLLPPAAFLFLLVKPFQFMRPRLVTPIPTS